ncbi:hypothetical protein HU200_060905 [Digitaria exilis]|uniref:Protein kinase domain-containing protein n=1 Tax=Digitaria exilis TaxID=1010633 RepID=A0A835A5H4_9POAL|nr:hypothetical protein HU200_060905 [Digitaria exilis]
MVSSTLCSLIQPLLCWFILFVVFLAAGDDGGVAAALDTQAAYLAKMKEQFPGPAMSRWDFTSSPAPDYCTFQGVACDRTGNVTGIDVTSWRLAGKLPPGICAALPSLRELRLAYNDVRGGFPATLLNCTALEVLNVSYSGVSGAVPDLSSMRSLRVLDMSNNQFTGAFPTSIANVTTLEVVNFNENPGFDIWRPPETFMALRRLRVLILSTTSMRGDIPPWLGNMTSLTDLELSGNFLVGRIPLSLARLSKLQYLELYYNELEGVVPDELGNLTELTDIDLSENKLTGGIPESLCSLRNLRVLQMYTNRLTGGIPAVLGNSTQLRILSVYRNLLTGEIPGDIGRYSPELNVIEVSENQLTGPLPPYACTGGKLQYILVLSNLLTGPIPPAYAACTPLLRFRVSNNHLEGDVPPGIFALPHASIVDLSYNHFTGPVPATVAAAANLTSLFASNNKISGELPPEIAAVSGLVKIDLSNNLIAGPIPDVLGRLSRLNQLSLQGNRLTGPIPATLAGIWSLNVLNLSDNALSGEIPESLCDLLPNSLDFSNNNLSGPVPAPLIKEGLLESVAGNPGLCVAFRLNLTSPALPLCPRPRLRRGLAGDVWVVGVCALVCVAAALAVARRCVVRARMDAEGQDGAPTSPASSSSYDVTSFHKLTFDQHEIVEALIDKNIVGHGGSGTVYKIELSSGELVAVKKLWARRRPANKLKEHDDSGGGGWLGDRELRTEVETLGSIRHKNIVKLYCCYSGADSNLLVYEYMPNGNLWEALHGGGHGCFLLLDWPTRHRVAMGVAQGLAYLHHDLMFPIVHRDIKSSNILLDADFEPKVADFGIAKVLQQVAGGDHRDASTTTIAGTYGYLAPEYAYSSKATTKCDVYSFGVVLMELATGRKPIEPEFGETRDIVHWVSGKVAAGGEADALDKRLATWGPNRYKEEMVQALRVAVRCTCSIPGLRPTMADVVQMLAEAGPRATTPKDKQDNHHQQQQQQPTNKLPPSP